MTSTHALQELYQWPIIVAWVALKKLDVFADDHIDYIWMNFVHEFFLARHDDKLQVAGS